MGHLDVLACKGQKKALQYKTYQYEEQWTGSEQVKSEGSYESGNENWACIQGRKFLGQLSDY